ncbi:MAG TPA: hypothetical protein VHZ31_04400 [Solirubrobacteraceae bacterium]|nr:hypothetical protein [Solirubrobacteraceae bacterium]
MVKRIAIVAVAASLSFAAGASGAGAVTLRLGRSQVGGVSARETARGTVRVTPSQRWKLVRYARPRPSKAEYAIAVSGATCVPQGELWVVGVQATAADPRAVVREHASIGVLAGGRLHAGAWAVMRYRTAPSATRPLLGAIAAIRVAPRRLLTVQARLRSTCSLSTAQLNRIAAELGASVRSVRPHVHIDT